MLLDKVLLEGRESVWIGSLISEVINPNGDNSTVDPKY